MNLRMSLVEATTSGLRYVDEHGYPIGDSPQRPLHEPGLKRMLIDEATRGKTSCYVMVIEKRHQGKPELFDPLKFPPTSNRWPVRELLASLEGRAKQIVEWATANGLTTSISYDNRYDPIRRVNAHEYSLVVSWDSAEASRAA